MRTGSGHVMRSSAIAEEAIARHIPCLFVGQISDLTWVTERVRALGFTQIIESSTKFTPNKEDILIIDSYEIPDTDKFLQSEKWLKVVSIFDDLTPDYSCDLRIHPGLTKEWPGPSSVRTLSGPMYAPLRKSIKHSTENESASQLKILVVGGGADTCGFVAEVANSLRNLTQSFHATLFTNTTLKTSLDERFSVSKVGLGLDIVANSVDLVFTTASTTSLEFLARGSAVAVGCAVDNQELYYKELGDGEYALCIGRYLQGEWNLEEDLISEIISSSTLRQSLRFNSANLIDMRGASRIVDEILKL